MSHMRTLCQRWMFWIIVLLLGPAPLSAQEKLLRGWVKDGHSDEPIPFASIQFQKTSIGKLTDTAGRFAFRFREWPSDTLLITFVGYQEQHVWLDTSRKELDLTIILPRGKMTGEVVIKGKINRGLMLWKKIVKNKPVNDRRRFDNFRYELYNKLEVDLNEVNKERLEKIGLLKQFQFVLDNIDTVSSKNPVLPLYLTETLSDYYYKSDPVKSRERIKAVRTDGFKNESVAKLLGGMEQNVNVYDNFIPVIDINFVSPISNNGDAYYIYKVPDTQYIGTKRIFHFVFSPKNKGTNTFVGDAWIADSSFAVMKMSLRLPEDANVNFMDELSLVQEFQHVNDSVWFLSKDKFVASLSMYKIKGLSLIGRKTSTYRNVRINDPSIEDTLNQQKLKEQVVLAEKSYDVTNAYWDTARHEPLTKTEQGIYNMIDSLTNSPQFNKYAEWLNFIGTGYMNVGNYQIGPWFNWVTYNLYEGWRLRWDLGTNSGFSKKLWLGGYAAYGFEDKKWKGKLEALYILNKSPRTTLYGMVQKDLDNGQAYYDELGSDNIFALAVRKPNAVFRFMKVEQQQLRVYHQWKSGLSLSLTTNHKRFEPLLGLPGIEYFPGQNGGDPLNTFEVVGAVRFAYLEKYLENTFFRASLGSDYPITELRYTRGISGVLKSSYDYHKLNFSVSQYLDVPKLGRSIYYSAYAGKTWGTLPYMMLNMAPGNNLYYLNKYAFNLMTRFEYLGDRYAGLNVEHNIGNGLFRLIPGVRKLKLRQFWMAKVLVADLSQANKDLNFVGDHPFKSLDGKAYMEIGTGIDNILKIFRIDFIWRVLPQPLPTANFERFGIFGSFVVQF